MTCERHDPWLGVWACSCGAAALPPRRAAAEATTDEPRCECGRRMTPRNEKEEERW